MFILLLHLLYSFKEEHYRSLYEQEVCRHGDTRSTLSEVQEELALKDDVIADLKLKHDAQLKLMDEQVGSHFDD